MTDSLLIPKEETQASDFLTKYPKYDGRGIVIAILDTGIDPGASGLSVTTDGKPKIIDCLDTTGSGDVDISIKKKVDPETQQIEGLSGRMLRIPAEWDCPSREFRIGIKVINQLLPTSLRERCERDWKDKVWNKEVDKCLAETQIKIDLHSKVNNTESKEYTDRNEELTARVNVIKDIAKWKYPGIVCDCLVWENSKGKWRAVVDITEGNDLRSLKVMGNFRETLEFDTFSSFDMFNYSVDIYPERNILVIVCNAGSHATHVAAIAAGNWPDEEMAGVAPGAQLLSIKIGDTRLGSMETGTAFIRAIDVCIERKVDLINYSYGEPSANGNCGPLIQAINEAVLSHNIIFVSSAGNEGPALCTVGSPGGTCSSIIGVGAFVTPSMMTSSYAFHYDHPGEQPFTWSSRGPTFDGWLGPAICAPGGAITSVPNWTLNNMQLMSGTSMSSPNACGCCALILSGLKDFSVDWSPFLIRRALTSTARPTEFDVWSVGAGLIQVVDAFEYCITHKKFARLGFNICVNNGRGILIRSNDFVDKQEKSFDVTVRPVFIQSNEIPTIDGQQSLIQFRFPAKLSSTVPWIDCPSSLQITNSPRTFMIKINRNTSSLPANNVYFGKVVLCAEENNIQYDFVPVTYIKPKEISCNDGYLKLGRFKLSPGQLKRNFLKLNFECKRATILLRNEQLSTVECPSVFIAHTNFHNVDLPFTSACSKKVIKLFPGQTSEINFMVDTNNILEICIGKFWNSTSDGISILSAYVIWSPIICTNSDIWLSSSSLCTNIRMYLAFDPKKLNSDIIHECSSISDDVVQTNSQQYQSNNDHDEYNNLCSFIKLPGIVNNGDVQVSVEWTSWLFSVRPSDTQIQLVTTLKSKKNLFRRQFTYKFSTTCKNEITVDIPVLQDILYDCPLISQMWMLFDSHRQYHGSGDALSKNFIKIPKGDYVILLQLVHEKLDILDQFKDFSINVLFKLSNGGVPAPDIYRSARSAIISKHKSSKFRLKYGKTEALYLGRVAEEKYPKGMTVGGCIRGNLLISATECTHKQTIVSLKYVVTDKSKKSCETTPITQTSSNTVDQYQTALRDFKVQWITKLTDETVISNILTESEDHLPAHLSNLERLCKLKDPDINTISVAFEKVKCLIDQNRLAKNLVSKTCTDKGDAGKIKSTLLEALCFMGKSLISKRPENWETLIDDLYRDTISWTEFDDNKVSCWTFEYFIAKGMVGKALSMIFAEKSNLQESRATELLRQMNWNYIADVHCKTMLIKYPNEYLPF